MPDEKFTIFASLGIQKNSEFANTFDFGLMKQAETGAQRKVRDRNLGSKFRVVSNGSVNETPPGKGRETKH